VADDKFPWTLTTIIIVLGVTGVYSGVFDGGLWRLGHAPEGLLTDGGWWWRAIVVAISTLALVLTARVLFFSKPSR